MFFFLAIARATGEEADPASRRGRAASVNLLAELNLSEEGLSWWYFAYLHAKCPSKTKMNLDTSQI